MHIRFLFYLFFSVFACAAACSSACEAVFINGCVAFYLDRGQSNLYACTICRSELRASKQPLAAQCTNPLCNLTDAMQATGCKQNPDDGILKASLILRTMPDVVGLAGIRVITGDVTVPWYSHVTSLEGLESLEEIGGFLYIESIILESLVGLGGLRRVGGYIRIVHQTNLKSLVGLEYLQSIGKGLSISSNKIESFFGLGSLRRIGEKLELWNATALKSLEGLDSLSAVGGLTIKFCNNLTSLAGLRGLSGVIHDTLDISECAQISSFHGLEHVTSVRSVSLGYLPKISSMRGLDGLSGRLPGPITVEHLAELVSFDGLRGVTSVGRENRRPHYASISIKHCPMLQDFKGLSGLRGALPGSLVVNDANSLESFTGLDNVTGFGPPALNENKACANECAIEGGDPGPCAFCGSGICCVMPGQGNGCEHFRFFGGLGQCVAPQTPPHVSNFQGATSLIIRDCASLRSLEAFRNVVNLSGGLVIDGALTLTSLYGLEALRSIGRGVQISNCPSLARAQALQHATIFGRVIINIFVSACRQGHRYEPQGFEMHGMPIATCPACPPFTTSQDGATRCFCDSKKWEGLLDFGSRGCGCGEGRYLNHQQSICTDCDLSENCMWADMPNRSLLQPPLKNGYWTKLVENLSDFSRSDIFRCFDNEVCHTVCEGSNCSQRCASGREGLACSLCEPGKYGGPGEACEPCKFDPQHYQTSAALTLCCFPLVLIPLHVLATEFGGKSLSDMQDVKGDMQTFKVGVQQLFRHFVMLGIVSHFSVAWPEQVKRIWDDIEKIGGNILGSFQMACLQEQQTATLEFGARLAFPFVILTVAIAASVSSYCLGVLINILPFHGASRWSQKVRLSCQEAMQWWGLVFVIFFAFIIDAALAPVTCLPGPNGDFTVHTFPNLQCNWEDSEWRHLLLISIMHTCLWGAVFIRVSLLAWRSQKEYLAGVQSQQGLWHFLSEPYRRSHASWPTMLALKDVMLASLPAVMPGWGVLQLLCAGCLSTVYAYRILRDYPFQESLNNVMEALSAILIALLCMMTAGLGFQSDPGVEDIEEMFKDGVEDNLYLQRAIALLSLQVVSVVIPVSVTIWKFLMEFNKLRRRTPRLIRAMTSEDRLSDEQKIGKLLDSHSCIKCVVCNMDDVEFLIFRKLMVNGSASQGLLTTRCFSCSESNAGSSTSQSPIAALETGVEEPSSELLVVRKDILKTDPTEAAQALGPGKQMLANRASCRGLSL